MNGTASDTPITFAFNDGQNATSMVVGSKVRSWANFSLLQLYYHRNAWANLHLLGQPNTFLATVTAHGARPSWRLCDLKTNRWVAVSAGGAATWSSGAEDGSLLLLSPNTPCHD